MLYVLWCGGINLKALNNENNKVVGTVGIVVGCASFWFWVNMTKPIVVAVVFVVVLLL